MALTRRAVTVRLAGRGGARAERVLLAAGGGGLARPGRRGCRPPLPWESASTPPPSPRPPAPRRRDGHEDAGSAAACAGACWLPGRSGPPWHRRPRVRRLNLGPALRRARSCRAAPRVEPDRRPVARRGVLARLARSPRCAREPGAPGCACASRPPVRPAAWLPRRRPGGPPRGGRRVLRGRPSSAGLLPPAACDQAGLSDGPAVAGRATGAAGRGSRRAPVARSSRGRTWPRRRPPRGRAIVSPPRVSRTARRRAGWAG